MKETNVKLVRLVATGVAAGSLCYAVYKLYRHYVCPEIVDEGFIEGKQSQVDFDKKVLVLGLDGSGKTSVISRIAHLNTGVESEEPIETKPTEGFSVTTVNKGPVTLNIWEIGGGTKVRPYWTNFLLDVDVLVFLVDSSDSDRMSLAYDELHKVMGDDRTKHVPVLILANKQDLVGAESPEQIRHLLGLEDIPRRQHDIEIVATQISPHQAGDMSHVSIHSVEKRLLELCKI